MTTEPSRSGAAAWELSHLTKSFGQRAVVKDMNLVVPAGSFYGIVGPNGAGKTTSILMGCGLLRPETGTARIFGADVWRDPVRAKSEVGLLPDGLALPERLTAPELLGYLGRLRGLEPKTVDDRVDELIRVLGLDDVAETTLVIDYSTGMRKKIGLANALLHAPRLLVLDEPFEGVDPVSASVIRSILDDFVEKGGSVVLSSHVMALVERLCTHVAIITKGRIAASGTLDEVSGSNGLEARFSEIVGAPRPDPNALSWLSR